VGPKQKINGGGGGLETDNGSGRGVGLAITLHAPHLPSGSWSGGSRWRDGSSLQKFCFGRRGGSAGRRDIWGKSRVQAWDKQERSENPIQKSHERRRISSIEVGTGAGGGPE